MPTDAKKTAKQHSGVSRSQKPSDRRSQKKPAKATRRRPPAKTQLPAAANDGDRIAQLNRCLELALNNMARGLSMFDANQRLIVCNRMYEELYDLPQHLTRPGTTLAELVRNHVKRETGLDNPQERKKQRAWIERHVAALARGETFTHTQHLKSGRIVLVTNKPLEGGGWVDIQEDITERRQAEQKIHWLARHDPLTEIANRLQFHEALDEALRNLAPSQTLALHWIDLDGFKTVNDTLGHPVGDALLKSVAKSLKRAVRKNDIVARLGGDEFAVLQSASRVVRKADAERMAQRLLKEICKPHDLGGQQVSCSASIGIAFAPLHGQTAEQLLKAADLALYKAKAGGKGIAFFYDPDIADDANSRYELQSDLRGALDQNQLELYYQPLVDTENRDVIAFEALLRWHHPLRGMIAPADFIPIAEETGLIVEIGEWALIRACQEAVKWPDTIRVSVNLSPIQFERGNLYQAVVNALRISGLAPHRLELEITEGVLLRDEINTRAILHNLRTLGARIALDDFGTAYASLSYLRSFPFDKIKIDRSFVRDLDVGKRKDCEAIIQAVAGLGKQMQISTVAEGIETLDQAQTVTAAGCNELQGFYFSHPVPGSDVDKVLALCRSKLDQRQYSP
ncbi:diguanylate cyclase/phosphodiesterase [Hyphomicrobium denitrificans ATCC 51888]|uniref:Diguanylate cyclase/phosphodiesterase n=1 Tax=Hyphomicrobium denitrificans (strain ATCC 51888 / DSM 1869 / NCIMB 11706 / TK 0415) TaxID=582899 RepID=D8JPL9_HYPDA|nr:diguanylate cyclase/phosphodiesterase [Hyphomicrobium denitrificans ATCC 51888]